MKTESTIELLYATDAVTQIHGVMSPWIRNPWVVASPEWLKHSIEGLKIDVVV